jgi:hypothetical protein
MLVPAAEEDTSKLKEQLRGLLTLPYHDAEEALITLLLLTPLTVAYTVMAFPVPIQLLLTWFNISPVTVMVTRTTLLLMRV